MTQEKLKQIIKANKPQYFWVSINALLFGGAVFFGAFLDGNITGAGILAAFGAAALAFITKIREFWEDEKKEYCPGIKANVFNFV